MSVTGHLGLGANLGDRAAAIAAAVARLQGAGLIRDVVVSPLYQTDAVAAEPQPPYLNAVARAVTEVPAPALMAGCLAVEAALGRAPPARGSAAPARPSARRPRGGGSRPAGRSCAPSSPRTRRRTATSARAPPSGR